MMTPAEIRIQRERQRELIEFHKELSAGGKRIPTWGLARVLGYNVSNAREADRKAKTVRRWITVEPGHEDYRSIREKDICLVRMHRRSKASMDYARLVAKGEAWFTDFNPPIGHWNTKEEVTP
jgi:hypothetical protein